MEMWYNYFLLSACLLLVSGDGVAIRQYRNEIDCISEYKKLLEEETCSRGSYFNQSQALSILFNKDTNVTIPLYLTSVIIDLTLPSLLPDDLKPEVNDSFLVTVFVGTKEQTSNFTFKEERRYYAVFNEPIRLSVADNFRFTVHKNGTNWHTNTSDVDHRLLTSYIAVKDFCSESSVCAKKASFYRSLGEECSTYDEFGFIAKYGHCKENNVPEFTAQTGEINWDTMQKYKSPILVFEKYTKEEYNKTYQYEIVSVNTNKSFLLGNISASSREYHPDCTSSPLIQNRLMGYFCINEKTGRIYATKMLVDEMTPIDTFVLTIKVKNVLTFPPRKQIRNITLSATSICSDEYRSFKELENKCKRFDVNMTSFPIDNTTLKGNIFRPYVENDEKVYLIYGIQKQGVDENADKVMVTFNNNSLHSIELRGTDRYRSFHKPVLYKINKSLSLYIFNMTSNQQIEISSLKWRVHYIDNHNYCSSRQCIELYKSYQKEYYQKDETLRRHCADEDRIGYKAKYNFCKDLKFSQSLTITPNISIGSNVNISNCFYTSDFKADVMYWLKDGEERIDIKDTTPRKIVTSLHNRFYKVPSLRILNTTLKDQGFYQCVVVNRERTIKSKKITFQISEVAEYRVSMNIKDINWDDQYQNASSEKYHKISQQLKKGIEEKFKNGEMNVTNMSRYGNKTLRVTVSIVIIGAKQAERKTVCNRVADILKKNTRLGSIVIEDVKIVSYDCCIHQMYGQADYKGEYWFPTILTSRYHEVRCKYHYEGNSTIKRQCFSDRINGARWGPLDLSSCRTHDEDTGKLDELSKNITEKTVKQIAHNVSIIASKKQINNSKNIELISDIVTEIVNVNASDIHVAKSVLKCVSAILNTDRKVVQKAKSGSSNKVLRSLKKLAEVQKPKVKGEPKVIQSKNLALGVIVPKPGQSLQICSYSIKSHNSSELNVAFLQHLNATLPDNVSASIKISLDIIREAGDNAIYSYVFDSDVLFLPQELPKDDNGTDDEKEMNDTIVKSHILSASVENITISNRTIPLELDFDLGNTKANSSMECRYWDPVVIWRSHGTRKKGGWSKEGCQTFTRNGKMSCQCNHLTNFAIILNVSGTTGKNPALSIITNIGLALSMICLLLTIITNAMFKSIRKKVPPKILINLSSSMFLMYAVFLIGVEQVRPRIACRIFAGLLQYFLLTTFFWMAIEAFNLYRNFVKVFSAGSGSAFLRKCYVIGWGVPLIITISTAAARWHQLVDDNFCVLRGRALYFAIVLPLCIILVCNYVILCLVLRGINGGAQIKNDSPRRKNKRIAKVRIAFACASLLGCTWIFALLSVGEATVVMQYIFCILTSLQGVFIFYFYTFRVKKVREEWVAFFGLKERSISTASEVSKKSDSSDLNMSTSSSIGPNKEKQFNLPAFNLKTIPKKTPGNV